jgi:hypothetical protein
VYHSGAKSGLVCRFCNDMVTNPDNPVRNHYFHAPERVQEHKADLADQAKNPLAPREGSGEKRLPMQGVIFQRRDITLLNRALRDPNHRLRDAALELMQGFTRAAERDEIRTLNQAASDYNIPHKNLSEWVAKGIIPYESRDQYAIYVRRETLDKIAPVYHEAKEQGKHAVPRLRKMHNELFPGSSTNPPK